MVTLKASQHLLTIDGQAVAVRVTGAAQHASQIDGLSVTPCDPHDPRRVPTITLGRGPHVIRTSAGLRTALQLDRLVLASDTLAKWLLGQVQQGNANRWMPLLTCEDAGEFEQQIRNEFYIDHIEDDDLTMLIIPIQ